MYALNSLNTDIKNNSLSKRTEFLKIFLTPSLLKVFELKEKKVNSFFSENNLSYNQGEFFRVLILNLDDEALMSILCKMYASDCTPLFYRTKSK